MRVIWTKDGFQESEFSAANSTTFSSASGDGKVQRATLAICKLCGGDRNLRNISDFCIWSGVEETYDRILEECFGVKVLPKDCKICERCVHQLRNAKKFKASVYAAFERITSESASNITQSDPSTVIHSQSCHFGEPTTVMTAIDTSLASYERMRSENTRALVDDIIKSSGDKQKANKKIIELLSKKLASPKKEKQSQKKRALSNQTSQVKKRTIVLCTVCGQRFPMIMPAEDTKEFVCSRCKLKQTKEKMCFCRKCNITLPLGAMREHVSQRGKCGSKRSSRFNNLPKKAQGPPLAYTNTKIDRQKALYQCSQCCKKYTGARSLADHVRIAHTDSLDSHCTVCGENMLNRRSLDQHMRLHTGEVIYECDICKRSFKGKKALQHHYIRHENFEPKN